MTTDMQTIVNVISNSGLMGGFFYWATQQFIPQMRREREDTLRAFREEVVLEREFHRAMMNQVVTTNQKAIDALLQHIQVNHVIRSPL